MSLMSNLILIGGLAIALIIVLLIAVPAFLYLDVMSYTATGNETLSPAGTPVGHALVAYDPGVSGAAKRAAVKIAGDLQSKGYTVDLAGIRSSAARNVSGYDVIVVGGPTYWDMFSGSAKSYLQNLGASTGTRIGAFATGTAAPKSNDPAYMVKFVTNLPDDSPIRVTSALKLVTDMNGNDINKTSGDVDRQCNEFVSGLLA